MVVFDPGESWGEPGAELTRVGFTIERYRAPREAFAAAAADDADLLVVVPSGRRAEAIRVLELLGIAGLSSFLPVLVITGPEDEAAAVDFIELGAGVLIPRSAPPRTVRVAVRAQVERRRRIVEEQAAAARRLAEAQDWLAKVLEQVIPLGAAAAREPDFDRLLESLLVEAMGVGSADGGTLYLLEGGALRFAIVRTKSLGLQGGGANGGRLDFPVLPLVDAATGEPNHRSVATSAALTGRTVNVRDVYLSEDHDFAGARAFDARTGYRTRSLLTVPLKDAGGRVVGVLQLVNATVDGEVVPFGAGAQRVVEGLAVLAAAVLSSYVREQQLRAQVRELRIEVDEGRKAKQVAEIVTTDYFKELKERATELRRRAGSQRAAAGSPVGGGEQNV